MPGFSVSDYTLGSALHAVARHLFYLPWLLVGGYLGLAAAIAGLWSRRRHRATLALVIVGAIFPLGYFPFWGTYESSHFTRISGPVY